MIRISNHITGKIPVRGLLIAIMLFIPSRSYETRAWLADYLEQKALCNYPRAMEILTDWTVKSGDAHLIETNLFRINELVRYPELIDNAVRSFDRISVNSVVKTNLFLKSRLDLFLVPLLLKKGEVKKALGIRDKLGIVREYLLSGPFKTPGDISDNEFTGSIEGLSKNAEWFASLTDLEGKLDIGELCGNIGNSVFLLKTVLEVPEDGEYFLMLGKTGYTDILLNGRVIFSHRRSHGFSFDQYSLKLGLTRGRHDILIRTAASGKKGIRLALRFLDIHGRPPDITGAENQGNTLAGAQYAAAVSSIFSALQHEINNNDPLSAFNAGYLFYASQLNSEEYNESQDFFRKILRPGILNSASDYYLGIIANNAGEKYHYFNKSVKSFAGNIESLKEIISLKLEKNLIYEAYPLIDSIKEINPRAGYYLKYKALALLKRGWRLQAINECMRMKSAGMFSFAYETEYEIYLKDRKFGEALKACWGLYKLDRYDPGILMNYADCCFRTGRYADAERLLTQGARIFPNNINMRLRLAEHLEYTENTQSALPYLLSLRRIAPNNRNVLLKTGILYHKLKRDELAVRYLSAALKPDLTDGQDREWAEGYLAFIRSGKGTVYNLKDDPARLNDQSLPNEEKGGGKESTDFKSIEHEISESLLKGEQYTAFESIRKLLTEFPAEPASVLYYTDLIKYAPVVWHNRIERLLKTLIRSIEIRDFPAGNLCLITLRLELEKLLYRYKRKEAESYSEGFYPVRKWSLSGPYSRFGDYDINYKFPPERISDQVTADIKFKNVFLSCPEGCLDPGDYVYPAKGVVYAASTIKPGQPVKIRVSSCSEYKLFINGREVIRNLKSGIYRNCRIVSVKDCDRITLMIKALIQNKKGCFRIIITDLKDRVLKTDPDYADFISTDFTCSEQMDYPFDHYREIIETNMDYSRDACFRLARYFHRLGSREAIQYYNCASIPRGMLNSYYYAECLLDLSCSGYRSALYGRACEITQGMIKRFPGIIPAGHMKINKLMDEGNYEEAFRVSMSLIKKEPDYLALRLDHARLLLNAGYEKEFEQEIEAVIDRFPHSVCALSILADYYSSRNIPEAVRLYKEILLRERCEDSLKYLVNLYMELGEYGKIVEAIKRCKGNYTRELTETLFYLKDYSRAEEVILSGLLKNDDPYYYIKLGQLSYLRGSDPCIYWKKALSVEPSDYFIKDLTDYIENGRFEHPFHRYAALFCGEPVQAYDQKTSDSRPDVFERRMVFLLNANGGNRFFCREKIQIRDAEAVDKRKNYRILFPGKVHPVMVRVFNNGFIDDSYIIRYSKGYGEMFLPSVREGSVVQISYYIDNPLNAIGGNFLSIPDVRICETGERVGSFSLNVIADREMEISFSFSRETGICRGIEHDKDVYSVELNNLSGDIPLSFSFSTMQEFGDLALWYSGLIQDKYDLMPHDIKSYGIMCGTAGLTADATRLVQDIEVIYNFVKKRIRHLGNGLYSPDDPENTLFNKSGSAEDKAILVSAILKSCGIQSYPALGGYGFTGDSSFVSPWIFKNILLYVPLGIDGGIWLDFSDPDLEFGHINTELSGSKALVIINDGYEIRQIQ